MAGRPSHPPARPGNPLGGTPGESLEEKSLLVIILGADAREVRVGDQHLSLAEACPEESSSGEQFSSFFVIKLSFGHPSAIKPK